MMRWIAATLMALAALSGAQVQAFAQDFPNRTITVIVPFAAGGPADITGRIVADILTRHLGGNAVVENVAGAGGTIGALRAARATPDGYTLLSGHMGTNAAAPMFYPNLGYDPQKDFEPISLTAEYPEVLVVRKDFPANNLKEFVAYAKANESKINMGHAGVGSVSYVGCLLLNAAIGIKPRMRSSRGRSITVAIRCWDRSARSAPATSRRLRWLQNSAARWCRTCRLHMSRACRRSTARRSTQCLRRRARPRR
jgi:tripartite-type tricarboxylate transporter receptor subunit TctC